MSLRSFIGFALFLCAGDLPAQAVAGDRSPLNDGRSLLEQLQTQAPHELTEQEKEKLNEENKQLEDVRKRHEENSLNISRTLTERRNRLGIAPRSVELWEASAAVNDVKRPSRFEQQRGCLFPFRSEQRARLVGPEVA